ncbi:uncharacterized protein LOC126843200 isoform X2 [Adelges cooleyi]|uniref:uncharacterized protein LOC126843200 isoform X2 n=1 Tax=Adelges cooleyi TaxID=133065 RepID=UPI0021800AD4|nr:uncharacterized protein LOC126843200 isoform X2 [Adelges cooleyi]
MFYRHYGLNRLTKMFQYILSYSKNITSLNNNNMISHFSLILLCLSGVYCVSSIDYLDLNRLKQIYYRQITGIKEWDEAMKQQIIYEDVNGTRTAVNVKDAVDRFMQKGDNSTVTEFESIRSIIKTAYQCTLVSREGTVPVPFVEGKDLNAKLYRDFTKSIPGKLPAHSEITASGCFVENLQFEISGFKTDIQNTAKPRDIYGPINYGRALELKIKLIETTYYEEKREEKIGMIMFSDKYKPSNDHPESSGHKHNILDQIKDKLTRFQFPKIN